MSIVNQLFIFFKFALFIYLFPDYRNCLFGAVGKATITHRTLAVKENRKIIVKADEKIEKTAKQVSQGKYPKNGLSFASRLLGLYRNCLFGAVGKATITHRTLAVKIYCAVFNFYVVHRTNRRGVRQDFSKSTVQKYWAAYI